MSAIKLEVADFSLDENMDYKAVASGRYVIIRRESILCVEQGASPGVANSRIETAHGYHHVVGDYAQIAERCGL